jgi:trehalose 6-phosphate synthase
MRILTCSNSGPRLVARGESIASVPAAPGGLVPILNALLAEFGGHWIYTSDGHSPAGPRRDGSMSDAGVTWEPLHIDASLMKQQRESISIRTLLWTFHYLHDTVSDPSFGAELRDAWGAYAELNRRFAEALAASSRKEADEVILVNDFHLMLVPAAFAATRTARAGRLVYFHHVPWCEPDYFGILPEWMRTRVLESLLHCDVAGFHCDRWGDAFLACCDRFLRGVSIVDRTVSYRGQKTSVKTAPGPIDAAALETLNGSSSTEQWRDAFRDHAAGRRIIARVDRLDLWKNLLRGFAAYETLLSRRRALADDLWFCAVVTPPRLRTDRHAQYEAMCHHIIQRINDRYGRQRDSVSLFYPVDQHTHRERAIAALSLANVTLVNPTFDGLNIVAKEAAVVNPSAPLLLSTNAGSYPGMSSIATPIQPFDVTSTTDTIGNALDKETRSEALASALMAIRSETPGAWLRALLGEQAY